MITLLAGVDHVTLRHPRCAVAIYVDGTTISAEADTEAECIEVICAAADELAAVIIGEIGGDIALDKAAVLASSPRLTRRLRDRLGALAGPDHRAVVSLGIDYAAGRPRAAVIARSRLATRFGAARAKIARLRRLQAAARSGRAFALFSQGVLLGAAYGAAVVGVDPHPVLALRRWAALCIRPRAARRSLARNTR